MRRTVLLVSLAGMSLAIPLGAWAQGSARVEVLEVKGIIDSSVERAMKATIERAESQRAALVVLQIDSKGSVGSGRAGGLADFIQAADVPVVSWVGPPGAEARNGAALIVAAGHIRAISPLSRLGPLETLDLKTRQMLTSAAFEGRDWADDVFFGRTPRGIVRAASVSELLDAIDGDRVVFDVEPGEQAIGLGRSVRLSVDPMESSIRFHKLDLPGRLLHAVAQPSIAYLLLLVGLVGVVFEVFHPSTGPAGVSGLAGLAFGLYGVATLGGSWLGVALIVGGVACFCIDLRYQGLGPFTVAGLAGLLAGSLLLFRGPYLRIDPWILAFGITSMVLFLLGAMTRVLRDLRAVARGELEVRDAHPHPNGQGA